MFIYFVFVYLYEYVLVITGWEHSLCQKLHLQAYGKNTLNIYFNLKDLFLPELVK